MSDMTPELRAELIEAYRQGHGQYLDRMTDRGGPWNADGLTGAGLLAVVAILDKRHAAEIDIAVRAKTLALKQAADAIAEQRQRAAAVVDELRRLAEEKREQAQPFRGTSNPLGFGPNQARRAYDQAAELVEQRLGGGS